MTILNHQEEKKSLYLIYQDKKDKIQFRKLFLINVKFCQRDQAATFLENSVGETLRSNRIGYMGHITEHL